MEKYYIKPSSFTDVQRLYDSTKPVREVHAGTTRNVRPTGDRARKWERVKKISDSCYLLMDGFHSGDDVFPPYNSSGIPTEAEVINLAPIVWRRDEHGRETVTFRNGTGRGSHNSRYSFLERYIPHGMRFFIRNGKQFIENKGARNHEQLYLAKSTTVAAYAVPTHRNQWNDYLTSRDDGVSLTFERKDSGEFAFVDGGKELPAPPRTIINKEHKAKYKQAITDYWGWIVVMAPLMDTRDRGYVRDLQQELYNAAGVKLEAWYNQVLPANFAIEVLTDYNSPMRLNMAMNFVTSSDIKDAQTPEDAKRVRAQFNRWINKTCGFSTVVK
jgi:hypothetical protein